MSINDSEANDGLDLTLLKDLAKKNLIDAFNSVNGPKTLVLDPSLAGPLGLVTDVSVLKQHGVDKMFWLESGPLSSSVSNIVYLCRPTIKHAMIVADQIKRHLKDSQQHIYTLLLVPRVSTVVSQILEDEGVLGEVRIEAYDLQFIPLADDVLSLERSSAFKELWVDGDESIIYDSAQSLCTLQKLYGLFPRLIGKGDHAARLATLLKRMAPKSASQNTPNNLLSPSGQVDCLLILDRRVDMITPLLTQLTYEGLIDEVLGIKHSHVELPASLVSPPQNPGPATAAPPTAPAPTAALRQEAKKKYHLTPASDPLFEDLRDLNFSVVGKTLSRVAHRLDEDYQARKQAKTVAQLKDFVGKLGGLQSEHHALTLHTGVSELLVQATKTQQFNQCLEIQQSKRRIFLRLMILHPSLPPIELMIASGTDMPTILRLLCLASLTGGGIKKQTLEGLKREILQSYGYHHLPLLLSLSAPSLGLLVPNPPPPPLSVKYPFSSLRNSLRLLIDDHPEALEEVENDISFTYSGYAPISVRLIQCVAQKGGVLSNPAEKEGESKGKHKSTARAKVQAHPIKGWTGFEDVLSSIPGETFDVVQTGTRDAGPSPLESLPSSRPRSTTTVVFFLGGCTYTELAAIRWLERQNKGRRFLVATTGMVSGNSIMDSIEGTAPFKTTADVGLAG
ncbi:ATP binding protein [Flagelloscypha sp. PMI_526]|nr:ATP binding protein [Flagelloscypha sp. PMI_526]